MSALPILPHEPELMSVEEYLHGDHDWEGDREYVDGVIEERAMGQKNHSKWQLAIQAWFLLHADAWRMTGYPELRVQTRANYFRVPDVTVLSADAPDEEIVRHPPLAVFEVLSPDDRILRVDRKLAEYEAMGIPSIYVVNPDTGSFKQYIDGSQREVDECVGGSFRFPAEEIRKLVR